MLHRLKRHELIAVAQAFMTPDEHNHLPQLHADIASYLTVTGDIPLPQFDAFLVKYRRTYLPPKKKTKQLRLVVEAALAAAQEQQQLEGLNKEAGGLQKDFYAAALEDHRLKHDGKSPTAASGPLLKLWKAATQSAHEFLVRQQAKDPPNQNSKKPP